MPVVFKECETCAKKCGTPTLCSTCLAIRVHVTSINALEDKLKQSLSPKVWKPEHNEDFCVVDIFGKVSSYLWANLVADDALYAQGNVFQTRELAESESERRAIMQELKELAGGYEYIDGKKNWTIRMSANNWELEACTFPTAIIMNAVYFITHGEAKHAIKTMGDKLKKLF